ncbi:uncharacterized protein B0I36DRAFT_316583 [Microdochium trichocladiopsis]|uniref:ENTH domain-containing protein n=1 Tax=Microdochium trichocladiopsis TaxID=1682393 RepID=A0A9P9BSB9_9PEZI|nr:uncharacterized protein B0I36DRAFT_316583 [Microdochium trichocladiopsis]KAH7034590.1 hypothetical protein B0I36DRAFT_316583 [Microdochium trichocladiopsis]
MVLTRTPRPSQTLNEIMPMIYRRFTEKSAEEWRQIYKALQLLEFLIKHGSERVIDDARGHITLLKMLRQFHYIDPNGKDQGINVRNRAKELSELLSDVEKIRSERKKARANKAKYTGVEGGAGGFSSGSSGRYGGFGSESGGYGGSGNAGYGGYSGGVYGDGGGFGGQTDDWRDNGASSSGGGGGRDRFEEYDEADDAPSSSAAKSKRTERAGVKKTVGAAEPPKKKEPEVDLFSFDDPVPASTSIPAAAPQPSNGSSAFGALSEAADDDDFDDFQSAPPTTGQPSNFGGSSIAPPMMTSTASSTTQFAAPKPVSAPQQASISDLMSSISPPPPSSGGTPGANYSAFSAPKSNPMASPPAAQKPAMAYQAAQPNYFQSVSAQPQQGSKPGMSSMSAASTPSGMSALNKPAAPAAKPAAAAGADPFANLWGASGVAKKTPAAGSGPKMGDLAKEKTSASLWGAPANASNQATGAKNNNSNSGGFGDLL